jgi:YgiT-type zinc finger domain-containing protein
MKCVVCKRGETSPGTATVTLDRNGVTVVVRGVPAEVCEDCGEEYVDEGPARDLFETLNEAEARGVHLEVREFAAARSA